MTPDFSISPQNLQFILKTEAGKHHVLIVFITLFFVGRLFVFGKKEAGLFSGVVHLFWLTARKGKIIIRKTKEQGRRDEGTKGRKGERVKLRRIYSPNGKLAMKLHLFPVAQYDRNIQLPKKSGKLPRKKFR